MRAEQEDAIKEMVRTRVPVPDSPPTSPKRSRTSPREVATSSIHLRMPASSSIHAGGLTLTPVQGPTLSSASSTTSEERPKRKREQQLLARAWSGQQPPGPPPPPPPPPPAPPASTTPPGTYSPGPPGTRGTISVKLENGDTLKLIMKEDGTYESVPKTEPTESPWPISQSGQVHLTPW